MEEALGKAKKGIDLKGERQTLAHFLNVWLVEPAALKLRLSTVKSYESCIRLHIFPALGDATLGDLTAQDVQRFLNGCTRKRKPRKGQETNGRKAGSKTTQAGLSPRSVQDIRAILRAGAISSAMSPRWPHSRARSRRRPNPSQRTKPSG